MHIITVQMPDFVKVFPNYSTAKTAPAGKTWNNFNSVDISRAKNLFSMKTVDDFTIHMQNVILADFMQQRCN